MDNRRDEKKFDWVVVAITVIAVVIVLMLTFELWVPHPFTER